LNEVIAATSDYGAERIASVIGRYYAMDRDHRWERTRRALDLLVHGLGELTPDPIAGVRAKYEAAITDEFMEPLVVPDVAGVVTTIQSGDSVVFFNYRADRARQITQALMGPEIDGADFGDRPTDLVFVGMMPYAANLAIRYAFEPVSVESPLARLVSESGLRQFHTAETEKYAHVTYFINGGREAPFPGEERAMAQSPRVATYDLQPEMSAQAVADGAIAAISEGGFDLVIINFANADMVGHTGIIPAAVAACETVDQQLGRVATATLANGGAALIIADHGNAEQMLVPGTALPMTAHTTNPVPCLLVSTSLGQTRLREGGRLADVAPTLLALLGIAPGPEMTGASLLAGYWDD
jgi:2,3-bisphosphoglycerate-independent phosphoglycerate mutase